MKLFIQVNIGDEKQKSGVLIEDLDDFYNECTQDLGLNIIGLMCLPPNDNKSSIYFSQMKEFYQIFLKITLYRLNLPLNIFF